MNALDEGIKRTNTDVVPSTHSQKGNNMIGNDDELIQCAAYMYDGDDIDTDSSGVFELQSTDSLYVILVSVDHKVAAIFEYVIEEAEEGKMSTMRQVSERECLSLRARKDLDTTAWLAAVCKDCDCQMCRRVLASLGCAA